MFVGLGIVLLLVGGVLALAVRDTVEAVDLVMVGWILMAGGALSMLIGAIQAMSWWSARSSRMRTERIVTDDGRHAIEETHTG